MHSTGPTPAVHSTCYHCGEDCEEEIIHDSKSFCCNGCKTVYEILAENQLCDYYQLDEKPGNKVLKPVDPHRFGYLDDEKVIGQLLDFTDGEQSHARFFLSKMHCSSCIWLLENLQRINPAVLRATVNFPKKEVTVVYQPAKISLRQVVELLTAIGYEPHISLQDIDAPKARQASRQIYYRLGVAGFCFGNIMMLSFPEYFSLGKIEDKGLEHLFAYLNLLLSLPAFFYSGSEFFVSAWKGLKQRYFNIDLPIALGITVVFSRSAWEILSGQGAGFMDSLTGLIFFMLIGRYFQQKTYDSLSFERDYKSYFPVSVTRLKSDREQNVPVSELRAGDKILIRNEELIPADALLYKGRAMIDYCFVTGESRLVSKEPGDMIYAGGTHHGAQIELEVMKSVSQSYLTQLWNNRVFRKDQVIRKSYIDLISKYFTVVVLTIASLAALYWAGTDGRRAMNAFTAVLIVVCPCALLMSANFTNGNVLRILGRNKFYLKDHITLERLADIDTLVFDKTGTITLNNKQDIQYKGEALSPNGTQMLQTLAAQSGHPLSRLIAAYLKGPHTPQPMPVENFREQAGEGIEGIIYGNLVRLGSAAFTGAVQNGDPQQTQVWVSINHKVLGVFTFRNEYREGLNETLEELGMRYDLVLLSGDNDAEKGYLSRFFPKDQMLGDGLNDAGALRQSYVGVAVSDNTNTFSPASDAIIDGQVFRQLPAFLAYARSAKRIILGSFILSFLYNIIGLYFAVQGTLSPVIAAILMPVSSVTIVLFTTLSSTVSARRKGL
jgi:Cu+-exporting ATPase